MLSMNSDFAEYISSTPPRKRPIAFEVSDLFSFFEVLNALAANRRLKNFDG